MEIKEFNLSIGGINKNSLYVELTYEERKEIKNTEKKYLYYFKNVEEVKENAEKEENKRDIIKLINEAIGSKKININDNFVENTKESPLYSFCFKPILNPVSKAYSDLEDLKMDGFLNENNTYNKEIKGVLVIEKIIEGISKKIGLFGWGGEMYKTFYGYNKFINNYNNYKIYEAYNNNNEEIKSFGQFRQINKSEFGYTVIDHNGDKKAYNHDFKQIFRESDSIEFVEKVFYGYNVTYNESGGGFYKKAFDKSGAKELFGGYSFEKLKIEKYGWKIERYDGSFFVFDETLKRRLFLLESYGRSDTHDSFMNTRIQDIKETQNGWDVLFYKEPEKGIYHYNPKMRVKEKKEYVAFDKYGIQIS